MPTRRCKVCLTAKPRSEFALDRGRPRAFCKPCGVAKTQQWVRENKERRAQYERDYYETTSGRKVRRSATNRYRQTPQGKQQRITDAKRYANKYPEKVKARKTLNHAIAAEKVFKKPCERCGKKRVHGHHDDYAKPLQVRWLCSRCHTLQHHLSSLT